MTLSKLPLWVTVFISMFLHNDFISVLGTSRVNKRDFKKECATFDFENGDLAGWTQTGTAFNSQPTYGDNPAARNREKSKLQGNWWIGGYENRPSKSHAAGAIQGDEPQGTLTSPHLRLTGNKISFLIGGGNDMAHERVEVLVDGKVVYKVTGQNLETMRRITWDSSSYKGKLARIRLIDTSSSSWGHINFDDLTGDFECAPGLVTVKVGCASWTDTVISQNVPTSIPKPNWLQTPSIVEIAPGHYRALGRVVHIKYLREQLEVQKHLNLDAKRKTMDLVQELEILADTIYIEGVVVFCGIRNVKIYAREIVGSKGSKLDVSSPNWNQQYKNAVITGKNGEDGKPGINGPQVDIICDVIIGTIDVTSKAGDGHKGQDGGNGAVGPASGRTEADKSGWECSRQSSTCRCHYVPGLRGVKGPRGGTGGDAGKPGNGGNAGRVNIRYRKLNGEVLLKSCRGTGAQPAKNGQGGRGGAGGRGGLGRKCRMQIIDWYDKRSCMHGVLKSKYCESSRNKRAICREYPDATVFCRDNKAGSRAASGPRGDNGASGSTPKTRGQDGSVSSSLIRYGTLDAASKQGFPKELLVMMRRQAEDLLLGNNTNQKGKDALKFILSLASERSDVDNIKNYVKRKLGFLGKDGYDIFGKNKVFAPRIKWETLEGIVEDVKDAAEKYESAFNGIISTVKNNENFKQMASKMSAVSSLQVEAEKRRLVQAKLIAESEKRMCVKAIQQLEEKMTSILENLFVKLPDVYDKAKFNRQDFLAVLQGTVGFANAIKSKSPLDFIDAALSVANDLSGKNCLKSLDSYLSSIKKWLTFGEKYKPLVDSSALDFDQVDVASVPEIMQANIEMNKEKFTAELVCLLDVASRPQDIADFKADVESFFIESAARIDLIAKIMDLDNDIGGYMFDIPLLEETEKAIADVNKSPDAPISNTVRQNFIDYLLSTYRELERSFMRNLYELHKAFAFRTLWEGYNPLASFQRLAAESALGTGRLNGAVQLTGVLQKMKRIKYKAITCFTNNIYTTNVQKWSFDNAKYKGMFEEIGKGYTKFTINIDQSCAKCYNVRLLKIYIELFGSTQPDQVPATVHLQIRHLSSSHFRAGDNTIKQYRQPVGAYKNIKFDRFTITDYSKCQELKKQGKNTKCSMFCITNDDSRWQPMCRNQLNNRGSCRKDSLLGMEECKSPFGTYELKIPFDKNLECNDTRMTNTNCKDLDLTRFTRMNVWTNLFYWTDQYPTGPDDPICRSPLNKRNDKIITTPPQVPDVSTTDEDQY